MENIPCTKHEAFPGMILRISTCNEALDSQNKKEVDSETGVVTVKALVAAAARMAVEALVAAAVRMVVEASVAAAVRMAVEALVAAAAKVRVGRMRATMQMTKTASQITAIPVTTRAMMQMMGATTQMMNLKMMKCSTSC